MTESIIKISLWNQNIYWWLNWQYFADHNSWKLAFITRLCGSLHWITSVSKLTDNYFLVSRLVYSGLHVILHGPQTGMGFEFVGNDYRPRQCQKTYYNNGRTRQNLVPGWLDIIFMYLIWIKWPVKAANYQERGCKCMRSLCAWRTWLFSMKTNKQKN